MIRGVEGAPRNKEAGSCSSDAPRKRREKHWSRRLEERGRRERANKGITPTNAVIGGFSVPLGVLWTHSLTDSLHIQVSPVPNGSSCLSGTFQPHLAIIQSGRPVPLNSSYYNSRPATPCFSRPNPHTSAKTTSSNTVLIMSLLC